MKSICKVVVRNILTSIVVVTVVIFGLVLVRNILTDTGASPNHDTFKLGIIFPFHN